MSEAIKYYEAALKEAFPTGASGSVFDHWNKARQVAALDAMADNERELGLGFYEPVGYGWKDPHGDWYYSNTKELDYVIPLYTYPQPKAEQFDHKKAAQDGLREAMNRSQEIAKAVQPKAEQEPKREPLTDEQVEDIYQSHSGYGGDDFWSFVRAIEAAHGIKGEA